MLLLPLIVLMIFGPCTTTFSDAPAAAAKQKSGVSEAGREVEADTKPRKGISPALAEPELLFPSGETTVFPAFSKFFLGRDHILGTNSELREIAILSMAKMEKILLVEPVEIEDFAYRNGLIYLLVFKNEGAGIMIMDREGNILSRFPVVKTPPSMTAIAVDSRGIIYHNNPSNPEGIITAYDPAGRVKRIFGSHFPEKYFASMKLLNRAVLSVDRDDNLIVAFRFDPIVRKYNSKGELLFEIELACREVLQRREEEKARYPERFTLTPDKRVKISAFTYFTSIACDERNNIFLKLGPESLVFQLDEGGALQKKYLLIHGEDPIGDFDFWESSLSVRDGCLYFPLAREGSESFGSILKYQLHP